MIRRPSKCLSGAWLAFCSFIFPVMVGCAERTYSVEGKVLFKDGTPLAGGIVEFESTTPPHTRAAGSLDQKGQFILSTVREGSGAMQGEHRVRIVPELPDQYEITLDPDANVARGKIIHSRYLNYQTSDLKVTVKADKNVFQFDIDRPPQP
jgi:hypothetical protein